MDEAVKNYIIGGLIGVILTVLTMIVYTGMVTDTDSQQLTGNLVLDSKVPIYSDGNVVGYIDSKYSDSFKVSKRGGKYSIEDGVYGSSKGDHLKIEDGVYG